MAEKTLVEKLDDFMAEHGVTRTEYAGGTDGGGYFGKVYMSHAGGRDSLMDVNFLREAFAVIEGTEDAVEEHSCKGRSAMMSPIHILETV